MNLANEPVEALLRGVCRFRSVATGVTSGELLGTVEVPIMYDKIRILSL